MSKQPPPSDPSHHRLSFYHQNDALLFQFFLHESLRTYQLLKQKPHPELLTQVIGDIAVSTKSWHAPSGHLPKLVHYVSLMFSHDSSSSSSLCHDLGTTLERACLAAKTCFTQLEKNMSEHSKSYTALKKEIRHLMKLLFEKLPDYRDNPSVLYFLLKHHKQLDSVFRKPMIKDAFRRFFPMGTSEAQSFFNDKFAKKGFDHLIPSVEQNLSSLKLDEN